MKDKITLLLVINRFGYGGAERLAVDLLNNFNRDLFEIHALTIFHDKSKNFLEKEIYNDASLHKVLFHNLFDVRAYVSLYKVVKNVKPDIVLSHLFFSNTVIRVMRLFFSFKVVCVEHNNYIHRKRHQILLNKLLDRCTDSYVAISSGVKDFFANQTHINSDKIHVIENGVDFKKIAAKTVGFSRVQVRSQLGVSEDTKLFINVGRVVKQKNQLSLLKAFVTLHEVYPKTHLIVVGDGPEFENLQLYIDEKHAHYITLIGYKENVHPYLAASDYMVLSSKIEGFGLVILEAYAHNLPVVSTPTVGGKLLIVNGATGIISDSFSSHSIGLALEKAVTTVLSGDEEIQHIMEKYDIHRVVRDYEKLLCRELSINC